MQDCLYEANDPARRASPESHQRHDDRHYGPPSQDRRVKQSYREESEADNPLKDVCGDAAALKH
jgi:hypothetical protein